MSDNVRLCRPIRFGILVILLATPAGIRGNDQIIGPTHKVTLIQSMDLSARGLTASVQMSEQPGPGYVAIRMVIKGIGKVPADRRLTFRFTTQAKGESPPGNGLIIRIPVTVAQGSTTTEVTRYFPKWTLGHCVDVEILEEGRLLDDSKTQIGSVSESGNVRAVDSSWATTTRANRSFEGFVRECSQDWLFVGQRGQPASASAPNLAGISDRFYDSSLLSTAAVPLGFPLEAGRSPYAIETTQLPVDWRGYQAYDVVSMTSATLEELANHEPAFRALRQWIMLGGTAIVYDATHFSEVVDQWNFTRSKNSAGRQTLIEFIASRKRWAVKQTETAETMIDQWNQESGITVEAVSSFAAQTITPVLSIDDAPPIIDGASAIEYLTKVVETLAPSISDDVAKVPNDIDVQPTGAGSLITIHRDANLPSQSGAAPSQLHWALVKRLVRDQCSPMLRQGTEPIVGHPRFRTWTIAGVLQPPVYSFMGILSLFVVLVGPVAYRQTTKHGRSHLMFVIAPVLAILTTLAMLAYGIIADGFGTQIRARQLTWVDGQSGDGVERVRASYFAGIRPSVGLRFPGSATVNRQAEAREVSWLQLNEAQPSFLGTVTITEDAQVFDPSFLPSRDQRQFVTHLPRVGIGALQFSIAPGNKPPAVSSTFSFPLRELIIRDDNGEYWSVEQLDAGQRVNCVALDKKIASRRLADQFNRYRPLAEASNRESGRSDRNRNDYFDVMKAITQYLEVKPNAAIGNFEDWLSRRLQIAGSIPNQHFIAISDVSDDVIAVSDGDVVDSVRYVFGTVRQ